MTERRCRSWRIRPRRNWYDLPHQLPAPLAHAIAWLTVGPVRCSWPVTHAAGSKWHCAEDTSGHVWYVRRRPTQPSEGLR